MIMTLWIIYKTNPERDYDLVRYLFDYQGTGKYEPAQIGSISAKWQIIKNLIDLGIVKHEEGNILLSSTGKSFMESLVKQTFDPDLPMRIKEFRALEVDTALEKIDS